MKQKNPRHTALLQLLEKVIDRDIIIAFSGGVDSSLLLQVASEICSKKDLSVHGVTFQTTLHPRGDTTIARNFAENLGVSHHIIQVDEMQQSGINNNPVNRCYLCKKYLFGRLRQMASAMGISLIMDGTNADDMQTYRPGIQALKEMEIVSPLAEAAMTKDDVRTLATEYALSVAERPSTPCLATRFPYGTALSHEMMQEVEKGEDFLRSLGFYNVRLRIHGELARIEVDHKDIATVLQYHNRIVNYLKNAGYTYITLDLEGFHSGSMDRNIAGNGE